MNGDPSRTVVFITGTFIANNCWDDWILYFESKGYKCISPTWPFKNAAAEELRNRSAHDDIMLNTISSVTDYFAAAINAFPARPILIGHSLGGLIVQLLLQRDLGVAGVAIHSFPPSGIGCFRFSFLRAVWSAMALFSSAGKTYMIPFTTWRYTIANRMEYEQQKELYYLYAVPESKKIIRDAFRSVAKIDFRKPRAPLLLTAGSSDKLIPAELNYCNYKKYTMGNSVTDYKEFAGHSHLVFGVPAWKREADCILHWLQKIE